MRISALSLRLRHLLLGTSALTGVALASTAQAGQPGLPTSGVVTVGSATIAQPSANQLNIITSTNRTVIDWQSFSIANGNKVAIQQPGSNSITVNEVTGSDPSQIFGDLSSNGRVVLANPNGIWFGPNSHVDVAGLVASTATLSADAKKAFAAGGRLSLDVAGNPTASIVNDGHITIAGEGLAALVAPGVRNNGVIEATLGSVTLASGETSTLDFYGDGLVSMAVTSPVQALAIGPDGKPFTATIESKGKIAAQHVLVTADVVKGVVDNSINMSGVVEAKGVTVSGGDIVLDGGDGDVTVSGTLDVTSQQAQGGSIAVTGGTVTVASTAKIDASGATGGGTIQIGGGPHGGGSLKHAKTVLVQGGSAILANATSQGDGGTISIWSDESTTFDGAIEAKGAGTGNGGWVETSSENGLSVGLGATVNTLAPFGKVGTWLLDPATIEVATTGGNTLTDAANTTDTSSAVTIAASTIDAATSNVVLSALTSITVDSGAAISITTNGVGITFEGAGGSVATGPTGGTTLNAGVTTNNGAIQIIGAITLANTVEINAGNAALTIGAVDDATSGAHHLGLAGGTVTLGGPIGGNTPINGLTVMATNSTQLGGNITTTAGETFTGPVTLTANVSLSNGAVDFEGTVDGDFALTLATASGIVLAQTVGGQVPLASLSAAASSIALGTGTTSASVTTIGDQTFSATTVSFYQDTVIRSQAGNVSFANDHFAASSTGINLVLSASADLNVNGAQSGGGLFGTAILVADTITGSLTLSQTGTMQTIQTMGTAQTVSGTVNFDTIRPGGDVVLGGDTTITATSENIILSGPISGGGDALSITASGSILLESAIGGTGGSALSSLIVDSTASSLTVATPIEVSGIQGITLKAQGGVTTQAGATLTATAGPVMISSYVGGVYVNAAISSAKGTGLYGNAMDQLTYTGHNIGIYAAITDTGTSLSALGGDGLMPNKYGILLGTHGGSILTNASGSLTTARPLNATIGETGSITLGGTVSANSVLLNAQGGVTIQAGGTITTGTAGGFTEFVEILGSSSAVTVDAPITTGGHLSISGAGITLGGAITNTGTNSTTVLTSTAAVTQSAPIDASYLQLLGTGGTFTLTNAANNIGTLAANAGDLAIDNGGHDLTIGQVGFTATPTVGITLTSGLGFTDVGTITLGAGTLTNLSVSDAGTSGIDLSQAPKVVLASANVTLSNTGGTGAIALPTVDAATSGADGLTIKASGNVQLGGTIGGTNALSALYVHSNTGSLTVTDPITVAGVAGIVLDGYGAVTIGSVGTLTGEAGAVKITSSEAGVTINAAVSAAGGIGIYGNTTGAAGATGHDIAINASLTDTNGTLRLSVPYGIYVNAHNGAIMTNASSILTSVRGIALVTAGADRGGITLNGTINATGSTGVGIYLNADTVTLAATGTLTSGDATIAVIGYHGIELDGTINSGSFGTLGLATIGTATQTGSITAYTLLLTGLSGNPGTASQANGTFQLTSAGNEIHTLAAYAQSVTLNNGGNALTIGQVASGTATLGEISGIALSGDLVLTNVGTLFLDNNVSVGGAGGIDLTTAPAIGLGSTLITLDAPNGPINLPAVYASNTGQSLTVISGGTVALNGDIGNGSDSVNTLSVTGTGITLPSSILTQGGQTFTGPVIITGTASPTSIQAMTVGISFSSSVDGATGSEQLEIFGGEGGPETITFGGAVAGGNGLASLRIAASGAVVNFASTVGGGSQGLGSLSVDNNGTVNIGGNITTTGSQSFSGPATLTNDVTLTSSGAGITFNSTIDSDGTASARALTINASGDVEIAGPVGGTYALSAFTLTAGTLNMSANYTPGSPAITLTNGSPIITLTENNGSGGEFLQTTYTNDTDLTGTYTFSSSITVTVTGGNFTLDGTIDGSGSLTIVDPGFTITINGAIGSMMPPPTSITLAAAHVLIAGSVTSSGAFAAHIAAGGDFTLSPSGSITTTMPGGTVSIAPDSTYNVAGHHPGMGTYYNAGLTITIAGNVNSSDGVYVKAADQNLSPDGSASNYGTITVGGTITNNETNAATGLAPKGSAVQTADLVLYTGVGGTLELASGMELASPSSGNIALIADTLIVDDPIAKIITSTGALGTVIVAPASTRGSLFTGPDYSDFSQGVSGGARILGGNLGDPESSIVVSTGTAQIASTDFGTNIFTIPNGVVSALSRYSIAGSAAVGQIEIGLADMGTSTTIGDGTGTITLPINTWVVGNTVTVSSPITTTGRVTLNSTNSGPGITISKAIQAGSLALYGYRYSDIDISAAVTTTGSLTVSTYGQFTTETTGALMAGGTLAISANSGITLNASAHSDVGIQLTSAGGDGGGGSIYINGTVTTPGAVTMSTAYGPISVANTGLISAGTVDIYGNPAPEGNPSITIAGTVTATGAIAITNGAGNGTDQITITASGTVSSTGDRVLIGATDGNSAGVDIAGTVEGKGVLIATGGATTTYFSDAANITIEATATIINTNASSVNGPTSADLAFFTLPQGTLTIDAGAQIVATSGNIGLITENLVLATGTATTVITTPGTLIFSPGAAAADGTLTLNASGTIGVSGNLASVGDQSFTGAVQLTGDTVLTSTGTGSLIRFNNTVDGDGVSFHNLTIDNANGTVSFGDAVGQVSQEQLNTLDVTAGDIVLGGSVNTQNAQIYNGPVTVAGADVTLSNSGGGFSFASTIDGQVGTESLTISAGEGETQPVTFSGAVAQGVGLGALTIQVGSDFVIFDAAVGVAPSTGHAGLGLLYVSSNSITLADNVTTNVGQTYEGAVTLANSVTLMDANNTGSTGIDFGSTLDGAEDLTLTLGTGGGSGSIRFNEAVGGMTSLTALSSLTVTGALSPGFSVTTSGDQTYNSEVDLSGETSFTSLNGGTITFHGQIVRISGEGVDLEVMTAGSVIFASDIGASGNPLSSVILAANDITLGGSVYTNGDQAYGATEFDDATVSLAGSVSLVGSNQLLSDTGDGITFYGSITGQGSAQQLTITAPNGPVMFDQTQGLTTISNLGTLAISSGTAISLPSAVTTSGPQTYTGAVELQGDTTITANVTDVGTTGVTFTSTIDGGFALTIDAPEADVELGGAIGSTTPLAAFTLSAGELNASTTYSGTPTIALANGAAPNITLTGFENELHGPVGGNYTFTNGALVLLDGVIVLDGNTVITVTGGDVDITGTIDGAYSLTIKDLSNNTITVVGAIGGSTALSSLFLSALGGITLGTTVNTTGAQTYGSAVTLSAATTLNSAGVGGTAVQFNSVINGPGQALTISGQAGTVSFADSIGAGGALGSVSVTAAGITLTGDVTTNGSQTYDGPVTLAAASTELASLDSGISFSGTINGTVGTESLMLVGGSGVNDITLGGAVGALQGLGSLAVVQGSDGTITLLGDVKTSAGQMYNGAVTVAGGNVTLTDTGTAGISFADTVDGSAGTENLTINAGGPVAFNAAVGGTVSLGSLIVTAASITLPASVTTGGDQSFAGAITLVGDTALAAGGTISLSGSLDGTTAGNQSLTISSASALQLGGVTGTPITIGGSVQLDNFTDAAATVLLGTTTINTFGSIVITGAVNGAQVLTLNDGAQSTAIVELTGGIGTTTPLASLAITALDGILIGGEINTTGAQSYNIDVTLVAPSSFSSSGGGLVFGGGIGGAFDLTISAPGAVAFNGPIDVGSFALSAGSLPDGFPTVTTTNGGFTLALSGGGAMTLDGNYSFDSFTDDGVIILSGDSTITTVGALSLGGTVDGAYALTLDAGSTAGVTGTVGGTTALTSLTVIGASGIALGGTVTTTGAQTYENAVTLANAALLTTAGAVSFGSTLDGGFALTIDAGSVSIGTAGGTAALGSLTIDAATATLGSVSTVFGQSYTAATTLDGTYAAGGFSVSGPTVLAGATTIGSGASGISFGGTVDGGQALTLDDANGTVTLAGTAGGVTPLGSLTINAGTISVGSVFTTGAMVFNGAAQFDGSYTASSFQASGADTLMGATSVTTTSGNLGFTGTVDGGQTLTLNDTGGTVTLAGAVGGTTALSSLTVTGGTISADSVSTSGSQSYTGATTLDGSFTGSSFTSTGAATLAGTTSVTATSGNVAFGGSIDGAQSLTLAATSGTVTVAGAVGGKTALSSLTLGGGGDAVTFTGSVTTTELSDTRTSGSLTVAGGLSTATYIASASNDVLISISGGTGPLSLAGEFDFTAALDLSGRALTLTGATVLNTAANNDALTLGTVDGNYALTLDAGTAAVALKGAAGANTALASLMITGGTITLGNVHTTGAQTYNGATTLNGTYIGSSFTVNGTDLLGGATGVTATAGNISFSSTVDGGQALSLTDVGGVVTLGGAVGSTTDLGSLTITAAGIVAGNVTTAGAQSYGGALTLSSNATIQSVNSDLTFGSTINGTQSLILSAGGNIVFDGTLATQADPTALSILTADNVTVLNNSTLWVTTFKGFATGTFTFGDHSLESDDVVTINAGSIDGRVVSSSATINVNTATGIITGDTVSVTATGAVSEQITAGAATVSDASFSGSVQATRSANIASTGDTSGTVTVSGGSAVVSGTNVSGNVTASGLAQISATENVSADVVGGTVNIQAGGLVSGNVTSTGPAGVTITANTVDSAVVAQNNGPINITASSSISGSATGGAVTLTAPVVDETINAQSAVINSADATITGTIGGTDATVAINGGASNITQEILGATQQVANGGDNAGNGDEGNGDDQGDGSDDEKKKKKAAKDKEAVYDYANQYIDSLISGKH